MVAMGHSLAELGLHEGFQGVPKVNMRAVSFQALGFSGLFRQ